MCMGGIVGKAMKHGATGGVVGKMLYDRKKDKKKDLGRNDNTSMLGRNRASGGGDLNQMGSIGSLLGGFSQNGGFGRRTGSGASSGAGGGRNGGGDGFDNIGNQRLIYREK